MITLRVATADTWKKKIVGLIGSKKSYSLLLKTRFGIHTFGLRFPIDIIVLNKNNQVVGLKSRIMPNRIFFWNPVYSIVIELPSGFIEEKKISIGSKLRLEGEK